jgi:threonine dehydrogenase-like Zn-dependent dehydrogenase
MKFTAQWGKAPSNSRDKALELVEDGYVSAESMLTMCLKYMSTDDVEDMLDANELSERFTEEEDYA